MKLYFQRGLSRCHTLQHIADVSPQYGPEIERLSKIYSKDEDVVKALLMQRHRFMRGVFGEPDKLKAALTSIGDGYPDGEGYLMYMQNSGGGAKQYASTLGNKGAIGIIERDPATFDLSGDVST